jgi:hypothetical protein
MFLINSRKLKDNQAIYSSRDWLMRLIRDLLEDSVSAFGVSSVVGNAQTFAQTVKTNQNLQARIYSQTHLLVLPK